MVVWLAILIIKLNKHIIIKFWMKLKCKIRSNLSIRPYKKQLREPGTDKKSLNRKNPVPGGPVPGTFCFKKLYLPGENL